MMMKKENKTLMFRLARIAMCIAVIGMYFGFAGENFTFANVFDVDDLVLAVGEETNNASVSFSFDGVAENEIVLSVDYDETQISWQYTLDRGLNWSNGEGLHKRLSKEELDSINTQDGIVVRITDLINQEEREFVIKIDKAKLPDNLYPNDLEDKLYGSVSELEWSLDGQSWTSFKASVPNLKGDVTLSVRIPSTGTTIGSDIKTYIFTKSTDSEVRKYVSLSKLTVDSYSSANSNTNAGNVLDGSALSSWKTAPQDTEKYIVLRVGSPIYLSGLNILGNVKDGKISTSMDGENWTLVASPSGLGNDGEANVITLDSSVLARYIRLEATSVYDEVSILSISKIDVFEDNTKRVLPNLKVSYDIVGLTNGNVIAQLMDVGDNIKVTSEGGLVHQFIENGSFKFTYENELGMKGEVLAIVDWIDKVAPTAEVKYVTNSNGSIKASLVNDSEPIEVVNNGGNRSYTFNKNGTFEFVFRDLAGNEGRVTAVANNVVIKRPSVSNNSSASRPSTDKNKGDNKPAEADKPVEDKPTQEDNDKNDNKEDNVTEIKISNSYSINNISIEVLGDALTTPLALKMDSKELSKTLKAKVGKSSSYFELYFIDADGDRVTINQNYKMILKLDSDKVFKGVFKVEENDKISKLEYTTRGANEIELNIDSLTNYIISYDEKTEEKKRTSAFDYIVALVLAVFLALAAVIVYKRTR